MINRALPYSVENEKGVLSCMLQDEHCIAEAASNLTGEHFYEEVHRILFEEILKNNTNDLIILQTHLVRRHESALFTATSIQDTYATTSNLSYYIEQLENLKQLRDISHTCTSVSQDITADAEPDVLLDELETSLVKVSKSRKGKKGLKEYVGDAIDQVEAWQTNESTISGVSTGLPDLDSLTMGLQRGEMTILAARPSVGKTALALHVANHACINNKVPTIFFSLEMSSVALIHRMFSMRSMVDSFSMRRRMALKDSDYIRMTNDAAIIQSSPLEIFEDVYRLSELRSKARSAVKRQGAGLIIVDYLQLIRSRHTKEREQAVGDISAGLKALAKELDVPVLALCQLNRGVENRDGRPRMSDLRESGSLEQDADVVSLLYRPYPDEDIIELIVAKQRNGPTGTVVLEYDRRYNLFKQTSDKLMDEMEDNHQKTKPKETSQWLQLQS